MSDNELSNIPNETGASATVNSPYELMLWDRRGRSVVVSSEDLEYWMAQGFRKNKLDPEADASKLYALFDAAKVATKEYVVGVLGDGVIDTSDQSALFTASQAMAKLEETYVQLMTDIATMYPVAQPERYEDGDPASGNPNVEGGN